MEQITGSNAKIIEDCILFARKFLLLPEEINYYFEDCPSERFPTIYNACESNLHNIYFNKVWFLQRTNQHIEDLEFFIFHELRHIYQQYSIQLFDKKIAHKEPIETILIWKQELARYVRNTGGISQNINIVQEVEVDANAYGLCLLNMYHLDEGDDFALSLPEEATNLATTRFQEYLKTKIEIAEYINEFKLKQLQTNTSSLKKIPIRKTKIGVNEKCPCGSGKKFKKCCKYKRIYD